MADMEQPSGDELVSQDEVTAMLAPILAGDMAAILLYGVLLSTFASFVRSVTWTRSPLLTRSVVIIVMLLTTAVTALYCKDIWDFGTHAPATTRQYVEQGNFGSATQPVFLVVVATIVQSVLVRRAANIINSRPWRIAYFASFACLITLETFAGLCACVYELRFVSKPEEEYEIGAISWPASILVWMWTGAAIDVSISATYIYNLTRRLGGVTRTVGGEGLLHLIISMVVRSAAYTAVLASAAASVTAAFPGWNLMTEDIYYAFWIPLPALYALSLFTTLSIRERVTAELELSADKLFASGESPHHSPKRSWLAKGFGGCSGGTPYEDNDGHRHRRGAGDEEFAVGGAGLSWSPSRRSPQHLGAPGDVRHELGREPRRGSRFSTSGVRVDKEMIISEVSDSEMEAEADLQAAIHDEEDDEDKNGEGRPPRHRRGSSSTMAVSRRDMLDLPGVPLQIAEPGPKRVESWAWA